MPEIFQDKKKAETFLYFLNTSSSDKIGILLRGVNLPILNSDESVINSTMVEFKPQKFKKVFPFAAAPIPTIGIPFY